MTFSGTYRLPWPDYGRGMGIFLVVVGHVLRGLVAASILPKSNPVRFIDAWIYSFHMPLFFFLSGVFAGRSARFRSPSLLTPTQSSPFTICWP
jgi:fucose 4-O-acetylase-like acetyltransferase